MTNTTSAEPTLTQLLDRLSELRPDWCSKPSPQNYPFEYYLQADKHLVRLTHLHEPSVTCLDCLRGSIEHLIQAQIQAPDNDWVEFSSGYNNDVGYFAEITRSQHRCVERLNQPNAAIALLSCLVEIFEEEKTA